MCWSPIIPQTNIQRRRNRGDERREMGGEWGGREGGGQLRHGGDEGAGVWVRAGVGYGSLRGQVSAAELNHFRSTFSK